MTLEKFKTRWRRWLGNKTRINEPHWVTLLDSNWIGWVDKVMGDDYKPINIYAIDPALAPLLIRDLYRQAIDRATMDQLYELDGIYCADKLKL